MKYFFKGLLIMIYFMMVNVKNGHAQTVLWSEDFQNSCASNCQAQAYVSTNGTWTVVSTGFNGADANTWYVSGAECGNAPGACGSVCGATDPSLHLSTNVTLAGDVGAAYAAGGLGFFFVETHSRVESPTINLTGQTNLTLTFNYIEDIVGQAGYDANDESELWYFDGITWAVLDPLTITPAGCGVQGTWTAFSIALPASANNNPNVKIGFSWDNNDDNIGTDPSFAVDDIEITTPTTNPPVASFTPSQTTLCIGDCINLTDNSTNGANGPNNSWVWTVTPAAGAPVIGSVQNPTNICWNTAGTFDITLTVDDGTDSDDTTISITVSNCLLPTASFIPSQTTLCEGDCINLIDNSTNGANGPNNSWVWTVAPAAGAPAIGNIQNPTNVCWNTAGSYDITLTVTDGTDTDDTTVTITVNNCSAPTASFMPSLTTICEGDCVNFTDNSIAGGSAITSWSWSFVGASTATSTMQNPTNICYNTAGTYNATLTVDDGTTTDDTTIVITVTTCSVPVANFSFNGPFCVGQCYGFTDLSTGNPTSWQWDFGNGTPNTSTDQNPTAICFNSAGTFDIMLIATNSNGTDTIIQSVVVNPLPIVSAGVDVTINIGMSTTLNPAGSSGNYIWSPILGLSCSNCLNPLASPINTTTYTVTVTDANGCSASDDMTVFINVVEGIGVPNAFSPNGDGLNDNLFVRGNGIEAMNLKIYNRYGQMVFESTDQSVGWDGKHNGKVINTGVFAYVLEYNFFSQETQQMTGTITLMK